MNAFTYRVSPFYHSFVYENVRHKEIKKRKKKFPQVK